MKKYIIPVCIALTLVGCGNEEAGTETRGADTTAIAVNGDTSKMPDNTPMQADQATTDFLMKAAAGGMSEVEAGKMAAEKATNADVKQFANMMVQDHTGANGQVKKLAAARNIALPGSLPEDKMEKANEMNEKSGRAFNKAYMDMMVEDHKKTIDLFEKAQSDSKDEEVKTFITNTLPKLKMHLDSAQAIQKRVK